MSTSEPPPKVVLQQTDYVALAGFRHTLRQFLAFSANAAKQAGVPPQQHQALLAIKGNVGAPIGVGDLAARLVIALHTATELVDRMVDAGLVVRTQDRVDRRRQLLSLTPRAEAVLEELTSAHLDELRRLSQGLREMLAIVER